MKTPLRYALLLGAITVVVLGIGMLLGRTPTEMFEGLLALGMVPCFGMIIDERTEFADAVSVAAAAGTALVGDVIDSSVVRELGASGVPVYLVISVDTEIITGGSAGTIEFLLASDAQAAIATDGSASVHYRSAAFVTDDAAANDSKLNAGGVPVKVAIPLEGVAYERYLGILVVIGTTTVTAGKINAFLTLNPKAWKAYPNGI